MMHHSPGCRDSLPEDRKLHRITSVSVETFPDSAFPQESFPTPSRFRPKLEASKDLATGHENSYRRLAYPSGPAYVRFFLDSEIPTRPHSDILIDDNSERIPDDKAQDTDSVNRNLDAVNTASRPLVVCNKSVNWKMNQSDRRRSSILTKQRDPDKMKCSSRSSFQYESESNFLPIQLPWMKPPTQGRCLHIRKGKMHEPWFSNPLYKDGGVDPLQSADVQLFEPLSDSSQQLLIQFPSILPMFDETIRNGSKGPRRLSMGKQNESKLDELKSEVYEPSTLEGLPEGKLGRIQIRRSGRAHLRLSNGMIFEVHEGSTIGSRLDAAAVISGSVSRRIEEILFLDISGVSGPVTKKLVISPVLTNLIDSTRS